MDFELPKVSIVIPVYNGSNYLQNAIDCALSQTYENLEVIVVNDGSDDEGKTESVALSYGDKIRYFYKENGGVSSALNLAIRNMTGEYFSWLSHDDAYTPKKVSGAIEALNRLGCLDDRTIAYSGGNYIDKEGDIIKPFSSALQTNRRYSGREMVEYALSYGTLNGCCMLIPKSAFEQCGGFDETLRYSQDSFMWYKLFFRDFGLVYDGQPNVMYRLHAAQTSRTRHELFEKDAVYIAKNLASDLLSLSTRENNLLYKYALRMAKYRCKGVVKTLQACANGSCEFTVLQKCRIATRLLYGGCRDFIKKLYYRCILRVKV